MVRNLSLCIFAVSLFVGALAHQNTGYQHQSNQHQQQQAQNTEQNQDFFEKQDIGHLKHDIKDQYYVELDEKTSESELEFYNFKLHDYDNNLLLDGLELLLALNHDHEAHSSENQTLEEKQPTDGQRQHQLQGKFDQDALMVDHILDLYDTDKDGYISFYEYMTVRNQNK